MGQRRQGTARRESREGAGGHREQGQGRATPRPHPPPSGAAQSSSRQREKAHRPGRQKALLRAASPQVLASHLKGCKELKIS